MQILPIRDRILVEVLPQPPRSALLAIPERPSPFRRAIVKALGPDASNCSVGETVLCNILTALELGDQLVLPCAAVVAHLEEP